MTYKGEERRKARRVQVRLPARYKIVGGRGERVSKEIDAEALNLSLMGLMLQTDVVAEDDLSIDPAAQLERQPHIELELDLGEDDSSINATARVIWVRQALKGDKRKYTAGILFSYLNESSQEALRAYIDAHP